MDVTEAPLLHRGGGDWGSGQQDPVNRMAESFLNVPLNGCITPHFSRLSCAGQCGRDWSTPRSNLHFSFADL